MIETAVRFGVIAIIVAFVLGILGTVAFSWTLDTSPYLQGLTGFLRVIYYVLPIESLTPIIVITISLMSFRIIVSIIKTIWQLIPIKG